MTTFNGVPFGDEDRAKVGVLGAPSDLGSSTFGGAQSQGPRGIRLSREYDPLHGVLDYGDVVSDDRNLTSYLGKLSQSVYEISGLVERMLILGGDDSICYGVLAGLYGAAQTPLTVFHLDAHTDVNKGPLDHSTWLRHAIHDGYAGDVYGYGYRMPGQTYELGVKPLVFGKTQVSTSVVLCVDIDWVDPAFAPGVGVPEPGGVTAREALTKIARITSEYDVLALVLTEVDPSRDVGGATQALAMRIAYDYAYAATQR